MKDKQNIENSSLRCTENSTNGSEQTNDELIEKIKTGPIPQHVAIIMDGNGRWAQRRNHSRIDGHREGVNSVREIVRASGELDIRYLTLYTFSKENWNRPKTEVTALMSLLIRTIGEEVSELMRNNVRLRTIGRLSDLPFMARQSMEQAVRLLNRNTGLTLNLALSYSSRQEITDAVSRIAKEVKAGRLNPTAINDDTISSFLYTAEIPDPDLLIRTSGEFRISNFLLWQLAYTEIYVTDALWPDFRRCEFYKALLSYQKRERRFGQVSEQIQHSKHGANGNHSAIFTNQPASLDIG